jgi:HK97 family phage portal protein
MNPLNWLRSKTPTRAAASVSEFRMPSNEWRTEITPDKHQLGEYFRGIISACATINAQSVAKTTFRLYSGEDEIETHPMLDLLNSSEIGPQYDLFELTQLYLEMYGEAYWYVPNGALGIPSEIQLLDATYIEKIVINNKLSHFRYAAAGVSQNYAVEDLLWFKYSALINPYITTTCPAKQAWNSIKLQSLYESLEMSICTNMGRPDVIITTKEGMGPVEQKRLESQYNSKFKQSGNGRVMILSGVDGEMKPMMWPPKDMAGLKVYETARAIICNNFQIPVPLLDAKPGNRAQIEGGFYQYGLLGVDPRVRKFAGVLTKLAKRYDPSLYVKHDDVVARDEQTDAAVFTSYKTAGILTTNEIRKEIGYEDIDGGDEVDTSASVQRTEEAANE